MKCKVQSQFVSFTLELIKLKLSHHGLHICLLWYYYQVAGSGVSPDVHQHMNG